MSGSAVGPIVVDIPGHMKYSAELVVSHLGITIELTLVTCGWVSWPGRYKSKRTMLPP